MILSGIERHKDILISKVEDFTQTWLAGLQVTNDVGKIYTQENTRVINLDIMAVMRNGHAFCFCAPRINQGDSKMKKIALIGLFITSVASATPVLNNGSFEITNVANGGFLYSSQGVSAPSWGFAGGGTGVAADNSAWGGVSPYGDRYAFVQGNSGYFYQVFANDAAYNLTFSFSSVQRTTYGIVGAQRVGISLDFGGWAIFNPGTSWTDFAYTFNNVGVGAHVIAFAGLPIQGGDTSAFIDNIALSAALVPPPPPAPEPAPANVPEPASLALAGLGLAGVGFTRRRKAAKAA